MVFPRQVIGHERSTAAGVRRDGWWGDDLQNRRGLERRDDGVDPPAAEGDRVRRRPPRGRPRLGRGHRRLPGRERPRVGQRGRRGARHSRPVPALRRLRQVARTCPTASSASTSIPLTPAPWRSGPGGRCRSSSATTATWAAWPRRSAVRGHLAATVLMLAPGSGLGCAFVDGRGLPLDGDTLAGMEAAHMPAPLHLLDAKAVPVRLRPDVGLCRGLHDALRTAASAGRADAATRRDRRAELKQRAFALARPRAEGRSDRRARSSTSRPAPSGLHVAAWRWRSIPPSW